MQNTFSIEIEESLRPLVRSKLEKEGGFIAVQTKSQYESWRISNSSATVVLYSSGKLVAQGRNTSKVVDILDGLAFTKESQATDKSVIGVDEVGKGDYFGALIVVAAYISRENMDNVAALGIKDSKKLSDALIISYSNQLLPLVQTEIRVIEPVDYNKLHKEVGNIAIILGQTHAELATKLYEKVISSGGAVDKVVFDQFSANKDRIGSGLTSIPSTVEITQMHKGEAELAVAAASVIARARFLNYMQKMNEKYDFRFPLGATDVVPAGQRFVKQFGADKLAEVAKISFRTTVQVLDF